MGTKEEKELIPIEAILKQIIHRKLAQWCVSSLGTDIYFMMESINLLRSAIGEKGMIKEFKDNYDNVGIILKQANSHVARIKLIYDMMEDKKLKEDDKERRLKKLFVSEFNKFNLIQSNLYIILVRMIRLTALRNFPIPNPYFTQEDRGDKRFHLDKIDKKKKVI